MAGISLSSILHDRPPVVPQIYGYILPSDSDHNGYIKIGYTDREDVEERISEQLNTATIKHKTLFVESAMREDGTCFTDKDVHRLLERKKSRRKSLMVLLIMSGFAVQKMMQLMPLKKLERANDSKEIEPKISR